MQVYSAILFSIWPPVTLDVYCFLFHAIDVWGRAIVEILKNAKIKSVSLVVHIFSEVQASILASRGPKRATCCRKRRSQTVKSFHH